MLNELPKHIQEHAETLAEARLTVGQLQLLQATIDAGDPTIRLAIMHDDSVYPVGGIAEMPEPVRLAVVQRLQARVAEVEEGIRQHLLEMHHMLQAEFGPPSPVEEAESDVTLSPPVA